MVGKITQALFMDMTLKNKIKQLIVGGLIATNYKLKTYYVVTIIN